MPLPSPERWHQIDDLFAAALERPADERTAFLRHACGDDPELYFEVVALLESDPEAEAVLGESASEFAAPLLPTLETFLADDRPEDGQVGPYRLVREIGRGGMGAVYLAERADGAFEQHVALKLVKRGMDTDEILRRFRYERQILASLQHPHIARLYDGGASDDGRPYLVMEHINGVTIDRYCDDHRLSVDERLALFTTVCGAVHYAHQNLVVHRDLKPSNILVTDDGAVKLLDFGIAKLLADDADGLTQTGMNVLTPAYAAPEQFAGIPVTTATDVYALGVVLYELLSGHHPYAGVGPPAAGAGPERPSTVVTQAAEHRRGDGTAETVPPETIGAARATTVGQLQRRLRGDLDTILLKALRAEPERRYASAEAFLEDLKRHLAGLPVQARPDSVGYRLHKFVRRHRLGVASVTAFAVLLTGVVAFYTTRVTQERNLARQERDKAQEVAVFLENLFGAADPFVQERIDTMQVHTFLQRGAEQVQDSLADQPLVQAQMLTVIGRVYGRLGLDNEAAPYLRQALETRRTLLETPHPDIAESLTALGDVLYDQGFYDESEAAFREALSMRRALTMRRALHGAEHVAVAEAMNNHALALHALGRLDEAEPLFREALAIQQNAFGDNHIDVATTLSTRASLLEDRGSYNDSEAHHRASLAIRRTLYGTDHPAVAVGLNNLAIFLRNQRRFDEAEPLLREAIAINRSTLDAEHPHLVTDLNILASVLRGKGDYEAADSIFREVLALRRKRLGKDHPDVSITLDSYAALLKEKGDYDGAERLQREAIAIARKAYGDEHMAIAITTGKLASILSARGDAARAIPFYRESLALYERLLPPEHPSIAVVRSNLGGCLTDLGRYQEAEPLFLESYRTLLDQRGREDRLTQSTIRYLITLYDAWGKPDEAARYRTQLPEGDG